MCVHVRLCVNSGLYYRLLPVLKAVETLSDLLRNCKRTNIQSPTGEDSRRVVFPKLKLGELHCVVYYLKQGIVVCMKY